MPPLPHQVPRSNRLPEQGIITLQAAVSSLLHPCMHAFVVAQPSCAASGGQQAGQRARRHAGQHAGGMQASPQHGAASLMRITISIRLGTRSRQGVSVAASGWWRRWRRSRRDEYVGWRPYRGVGRSISPSLNPCMRFAPRNSSAARPTLLCCVLSTQSGGPPGLLFSTLPHPPGCWRLHSVVVVSARPGSLSDQLSCSSTSPLPPPRALPEPHIPSCTLRSAHAAPPAALVLRGQPRQQHPCDAALPGPPAHGGRGGGV